MVRRELGLICMVGWRTPPIALCNRMTAYVAVMVPLLLDLLIAYSRRLGCALEAGCDGMQRQRGDAQDDVPCIWTSHG